MRQLLWLVTEFGQHAKQASADTACYLRPGGHTVPSESAPCQRSLCLGCAQAGSWPGRTLQSGKAVLGAAALAPAALQRGKQLFRRAQLLGEVEHQPLHTARATPGRRFNCAARLLAWHWVTDVLRPHGRQENRRASLHQSKPGPSPAKVHGPGRSRTCEPRQHPQHATTSKRIAPMYLKSANVLCPHAMQPAHASSIKGCRP
jgi:hypothetical protein